MFINKPWPKPDFVYKFTFRNGNKCFYGVCLLIIFFGLSRLHRVLISSFNEIFFFFFWISGVGKSSLIKQYILEMDPSEIAPTVGVSFSTFKIKLEDGKVKMQVRYLWWQTLLFWTQIPKIPRTHSFESEI